MTAADLAALGQMRADYLAEIRATLEPLAAEELRGKREQAAKAVSGAEVQAAKARAAYAPYAERLARLESRIAATTEPIPLPDIENCTNAEYLESMRAEAERAVTLPRLQQRFNDIQNQTQYEVRNIHQADAAVKSERAYVAELDEAIAAPFASALGLETSAGVKWRALAGTGDPSSYLAAGSDSARMRNADRRVRTRKDGTKLAVINPREITPHDAAHAPSAQPLWGTTSGPAGNADDPARIPDDFEMRRGIPGAGQ